MMKSQFLEINQSINQLELSKLNINDNEKQMEIINKNIEEKPSSLIRNITKNLERTKTQKTSLFEQSKFKSKSNKNKCYSKLKDFLFLSFHNVILIFIIFCKFLLSFTIFLILNK